ARKLPDYMRVQSFGSKYYCLELCLEQVLQGRQVYWANSRQQPPRFYWHYWPSPAQIAAPINQLRRWQERMQAIAPSPDASDTLGWRGWRCNGSGLMPPARAAAGHETPPRADAWTTNAAVRGEAGSHAIRMPRDWLRADPAMTEIGGCKVHGIVERFGHYVLGTEGWRAEWVVIRELMAPNAKTALALMQKYPEVRIHVKEQETSNEDR